MKAKHRNSNRPNSLENSAKSESVIRLILNAIFEEIVFSRRNFFSVIFAVKMYPNAQTQNIWQSTVLHSIQYSIRNKNFIFKLGLKGRFRGGVLDRIYK